MARVHNCWTGQPVWKLCLFCMALGLLYIHEMRIKSWQRRCTIAAEVVYNTSWTDGPFSDLLGAGSIWSSNVDSALIWIWIGPSGWWIGVDLRLIWLLELQIYTQFGLRLRRNRVLRSQCIRGSQSATLLTLPLTYCLISSVLAIEYRTPGHPALTTIASAVAALHLHLLLWYCIWLSCLRNETISLNTPTSTI